MCVTINQSGDHRVFGKIDGLNVSGRRVRNSDDAILGDRNVSVGGYAPAAHVDQATGVNCDRGFRGILLCRLRS